MTLNTGHKEKVFLQYGFLYVFSNYHHEQMSWDTDYKEKIFLQYEFFYEF